MKKKIQKESCYLEWLLNLRLRGVKKNRKIKTPQLVDNLLIKLLGLLEQNLTQSTPNRLDLV